jgi:predicted nuclease of predicted toxin-antitoxin system
LVVSLADFAPGSRHVVELGLDGAEDEAIWRVARDEGYILISKDDDFRQLCLLRGAPPKVIWLKIGNCSTDEIEALVRESAFVISTFVADPVGSLLILP